MLTAQQRLCIYYDSTLSNEDALGIPDELIMYGHIRAHECTWRSISAANLKFESLLKRGFDTVDTFHSLGMDSFDLAEITITHSMIRSFGADLVKRTFLLSGMDAVALAGTESARLLSFTLDDMLTLCAGEPINAQTVLIRMRPQLVMPGQLKWDRLRDAGVGSKALAVAGVTMQMILALDPPPKTSELSVLGFNPRII